MGAQKNQRSFPTNMIVVKFQTLIPQEDTKSGLVVVEPLTEKWIPKLADLLVESFRGALGYKGMRCVEVSHEH